MSARYDIIVIGAGHNGLTAAALLARAGRAVLVVERRDTVGGTAGGEEFHPGFRSPGLHHDATGVAQDVVRRLELERHGLALRECRPDVLGLDSGLLLRGDPLLASREIAALSTRDGARYLEFRRFLDRVRGGLESLLLAAPLDLLEPDFRGSLALLRRAVGLRRLGAQTMMELLRLPPMAVADWLGEWFESEALKALLALPAVAGTHAGPRSPGTTLNLLRGEAAGGPGVAGGGPALVAALERAARQAGVEIRTGAPVRGVLTSADGARGVALEGGEEIAARTVAASCDPKRLFLDLLPQTAFSSRLAERIRCFRTRGTTAQVLLALARPPRFAARPDDPVELARSGACLDDLERAFDAVKYRGIAERPVLDVLVARALAPAGAAALSVLVHFVPYDLAGGTADGQRERLAESVVARLERYAPGVASAVVGRTVLLPVDLESRYALTGGQLHQGEHALDQLLVRPAPECARYQTPVRGLYLCGSGAHPGGGLTCRPGSLAAAAILS